MICNLHKNDIQFALAYYPEGNRLRLPASPAFRLLCLLEGSGMHIHGNAAQPLFEKDIMIVPPNESGHTLQADTTMEVLAVTFTELFIHAATPAVHGKNGLRMLLRHATLHPQYVTGLRNKQALMHPLMDSIVMELHAGDRQRDAFTQQLFYTALMIIGHEIKALLPERVDMWMENKISEMLHFIHQHICCPEKLTTTALGRQFCIAPAYIGRYFKNYTKQNLCQYILSYKIKLIEDRLMHSGMRINEIAHAFGFSDNSYLNKVFVRQNGMTPLAFRKRHQADTSFLMSATLR